jgi:hypothetical protein
MTALPQLKIVIFCSGAFQSRGYPLSLRTEISQSLDLKRLWGTMFLGPEADW